MAKDWIMLKWLLGILVVFSFTSVASQTCCSGGVPLSGNVGFTSFDSKLYQFDFSYDFNSLNSLYTSNELLQDESRLRLTQSVLLKAGLPISDHFAADVLFTYVFQKRVIDQFGGINTDLTSGIGDAVVLIKYAFRDMVFSGISGQMGVGPKVPLGTTSRANEQGFRYNADLQPGSGSWDLLSWIYLSREARNRPQRNINLSLTYRFNGSNKHYLDFTDYKFGNSYQVVFGFGDQLMLADLPLSLGLSLKHRRAFGDKLSGLALANTGGSWLFIVPAISVPLSQNLLFSLTPEIPVYNHVEGTQLTTTFRIRAGLYFSIKPKIKLGNDPLFEGL